MFKIEFSKLLLIQESALMWIHTIAHIALAFYCIAQGYTGSLPWLAASASFPWAAYGVSQTFYYKKALVENSQGGIKYETVLRELDASLSNPLDLDFSDWVTAPEEDMSDSDDEYVVDLDYGI